MRKISMLIMAFMGLFLLSGCVKLDADIEVHKDDTVSGSMIYAVEKDSAFADEMDSNDETDFPEGSKVETYDEDGYIGQKATFDNVPIDEMFTDDEATITHKDGKFTLFFAGDEEMSAGSMEDLPAEYKVLFDSMKISLKFTFPGKVLSASDGVEIDGNTVVIGKDAVLSGKDITIVAEDTGAGAGGVMMFVLLALLVVLAGAALLVVKMKKDKMPEAPAATDTLDTPETPESY